MSSKGKRKPITKQKKPGRKRTLVTHADFVREPDKTMLTLADMKNEGHSWRTLASEINDRLDGRSVSHTLIRQVALGHCESELVDYALGVSDKPPPTEVPTCPNCGQAHTVDWCVHEEGQPKKPRSKKSKRKRKPRFSVAAYDVELAIGQLEKYYPEIDWRSALDGGPVDSS